MDSSVAAQNPAMLSLLQNRLDSLVGQSSGYIESLPTSVRRRLNALQNLQDKHGAIEADFREEVLALEKKYLTRYQPLYDERKSIISGEVEPTDELCKREEEEESKEAIKDETEEKKEEAVVSGVPEFWLTCFKNQSILSEAITEKDEEALKHLQDIKVTYLDGNPGFKLDFYFESNPYFTDSVLSKTYFLENSPETTYGDVMYDHAEGCEIHWKDGKDLSVTVEIKKQRHKGTNKTRTVKKTVPADTFFQFFAPPKAPVEGEETDEEELQELDAKLEHDYEIGEIIKEKIVPHAVDWFTGRALEFEDPEFDEDDMGDWSGEEDEDDDEEEDDDEDGDNAAEGEQAAGGEKPQECKQQ
ncbi:putative nucleosome assembly protein Nap1 [Phlyctochytrium arcticum]|nr:putative nucleosome assembly protein Nap1 [Phlyctochytrium arcticum]